METDLFGLPVGKTATRTEWAVRWPNRPYLPYTKPDYVNPAANEKHAKLVAGGPPGATWAPGVVIRREVVTVTGPWEEVATD